MEITEWEGIKGKECTTCLEWKPLDEFTLVDTNKRLYSDICKVCSDKTATIISKLPSVKTQSSPKKIKEIVKKISKSKNDSFKKITYLVSNEVVEAVNDLSHLTGEDKGDILGELVKKGLNNSKKYKEMLSDYHTFMAKYKK